MSMFMSTPANPYDDVVLKATDETLTGENWEMILNLCDKVQDEGEQGARNVIAAVLKRLAHRNPNVQLYSLTLTESLSKNCGKELHREIASRAFTQALERLITDRTTHDKVRNRALMLIAMWTEDFDSDPTLGIMEECYEDLKAKDYKFKQTDEPPPHDDDEARRREEEELQRVLELSMQDKGGRRNWNEYSLASSSGAGGSGGSGSQASTQASSAAHPPAAAPTSSISSAPPYDQHARSTGYVPSIETQTQTTAPPPAESSPQSTSATPTSPTLSTSEGYAVSRVRALHSFEPTEPNELAFEKGDVIKVVNREYKDWWRGQIRGRTGIFPVNYVEFLPEPTSAELAAEAQQEASVFSQAANVDRLLTMLRTLDPAKDNLADNEEIQELYRSCMSLRPKIVKLIDKYSQKRADLVSMNESFVRARTIFDRMMEESLARHSEFYEQQRPAFPQLRSTFSRPDSRVPGQQAPSYGRPADQPQAYGWNPNVYDQPGYGVPPNVSPAYTQPRPDPRVNLGRSASYASGQVLQSQPQPQAQPPSQQAQQGPQPQPQTAYAPPYPAQDNPRASYYPQAQPQQAEAPPPRPEQTQTAGQPQTQQQQPQVQLQPHPESQHSSQQPQQPQVQSQLPAQTQPHVQTQDVVQQQQQQQQQQQPAQAQASHSPVEAHASVQPQPQQAQAQAQAQNQQQQTMTGPPFAFDPNATYPDQNVQAWAQYYAQGGTDPTGSVYFISVPGVTDAHSPSATAAAVQPGAAEGQQQQQQQTTTFSGSGPAPGAIPGHVVTQGLQRQNSLPNPYGPSSATSGETDMVGSVSAGPGGPGMGARAPWDTSAGAARSSLSGQFAQMRVGEPSVGA